MIIEQASKIDANTQVVNNKGQIVNQTAFNTALLSLMENKFKGGMELQSKTLSGTMSTLKGTFSTTLASIAGVTDDGTVKAGGALDRFKGIVQSVSDKLQNWSNNGGVEKACNTVEGAFNNVGKAVGFVKDNANWLIPVLGGTVGAFTALKVISSVKIMMDLWKASTIAMTFAQGGLNAVMALSPFTWIVMGIGAVIAIGIALYMHWDVVKAKAIELKDGAVSAFENLKTGVIEKVNSLKEKVASIWEDIKTIFSHPLQAAVSLVKNGDLSGVDGSHKTGLTRVPKDNYVANLHQGERVLTKSEADTYDRGQGKSGNITIAKLADSIVVKEESDIDKITELLANKLKTKILNLA